MPWNINNNLFQIKEYKSQYTRKAKRDGDNDDDDDDYDFNEDVYEEIDNNDDFLMENSKYSNQLDS